MKKVLVCILLSSPLISFSQKIDSLAITRHLDSLWNIAFSLSRQGDFKQAFEIQEEAEQLALAVFTEESEAFGKVCIRHGVILNIQGNYPESEQWYLKGLGIYEKTIGQENILYTGGLVNLGILNHYSGDYEEAERYLGDAKSFFENNVVFQSHPYYFNCLNSLGNLYSDTEEFEKAESMYLKSISTGRKIFGNNKERVTPPLNGLANLYSNTGRLEESLALFKETLGFKASISGKDNISYAISLYSFAILNQKIGNFEQAEKMLFEAKDIYEATLGTNHLEYARTMNALAVLNANLGQFEKTERYYLQSIAILKEAIGSDHPEFGLSLNNLASLYYDIGEYDKAKALFEEALTITESKLGKTHSAYVRGLVNLANVHVKLEEYHIAEGYLLKAKAIFEEHIRIEDIDYVHCLQSLARLYVVSGKLDKAESIYLQAENIWDEKIGNRHPLYARCLRQLAEVSWLEGDYEMADSIYDKLTFAERTLISLSSMHLSEEELFNYLDQFKFGLDKRLSFNRVFQNSSDLSYESAIFYKEYLLNSFSKMAQLVQKDSLIAGQFYLFKSYHRRLAKEYEKPIAERQNVEELEAKTEALEKVLVRTVAGFDDAVRHVTWQEVQSALGEKEAAIEFVHFNHYSPYPTDSVLYAALVLRPGWEQPKWVYLCEDGQLKRLLQDPNQIGARQAVDQLYTSNLYDLVWAPLDSLLDGAERVYFSPSGLLHRISFPAMPVDDTTRLVDALDINYVSSTRNLVIEGSSGSPDLSSAVVYGGLHYSVDTTGLLLAFAGGSRGKDEFFVGGTSLVPEEELTRSRIWYDLPKSEEERARLDQLFKSHGLFTMSLRGYEGTEESFKSIGETYRSPDVIHLATHGFFFPDPELDPKEQEARLLGGQSNYRFSDNPLLRSGLILSGGNKAWKDGEAFPGREDGILTAYEISQMNLTGTKLVVLSACETGLGDIKGSEGVYGLQRAFKRAGADYLVMTLWSIPDSDETVDFMETFYTHLLSETPVREAFNQTQREMRERNEDPYYWAGFVLVE